MQILPVILFLIVLAIWLAWTAAQEKDWRLFRRWIATIVLMIGTFFWMLNAWSNGMRERWQQRSVSTVSTGR